MKKLVFLTFILLFSAVSFCQDKLLLSENFKNNKNGWRLRHDSSFSVIIDKGVLHLEKLRKNFDDRGCLWLKKEIKDLNTAEDFSITFFAKFLSGGDHTDMIDIQWGAWDKVISSKATSIYQLNFFLKGDVKLDHFSKQWNYSLRSKAKEILSRNLYQPGKFNKYEVLQQDGFIILKINDQQYFKQFVTPINGNAIGIQGCLKSAWEIDKIIVKQLKRNTANKPDSIHALTVIDSLKISDKTGAGNLKVFPNPFINEFTIVVSPEKAATAKIELLDIQGSLITEYDRKLEAGQEAIRMYADVPAGTYILKLTLDGKVTTAKLVKM